MKKLFLFAVAAGMFFVACNGGSTPAQDSTATATEAPATSDSIATPATDSTAVTTDSTATGVDTATAK